MTRDVAPRLGRKKPALIHSKFFPALQGSKTKMSASSASSTIMVTDSPTDVRDKVTKYAFSGGRGTLAEHRALGANLEVDVAYQYLRFFMEDDAELERVRAELPSRGFVEGEGGARGPEPRIALPRTPPPPHTHTHTHTHTFPLQIGAEYGAGRMLTSEVKACLVGVLVPMVEAHQAARRAVTDEVVKTFMTPRPLDFAGMDATRR